MSDQSQESTLRQAQGERVKSQEKLKIKKFSDLIAWQKAHVLAVAIYKNTADFPSSEQLGLTNQMRRAAYSVSSNIAEGFGRRTVADRTHFYDMARASLAELQSQLLLARDVDYLKKPSFDKLAISSSEAHKVISGLINATRKKS